MAKQKTHLIKNLRKYLSQAKEHNEDLAIAYFRDAFGEEFKRQSDAANADGYVPNMFVLELKGRKADWLSGLFQSLAYKNKGLAFPVVIVAAENFLAAWKVEDIPDAICDEIYSEKASPSTLGKKYARKYSKRKKVLLKKAVWYRPDLFEDLFDNEKLFSDAIKNFEKTVRSARIVRQGITLRNFSAVLKKMKKFFDPDTPIKTVRAFYTMIYGPWDDTSILMLNERYENRATLGGVSIQDLVPSRRKEFKEFVESHAIQLNDSENIDGFFAKYDEALDAVDKKFRVRNGIFFTDLDLSRFVMWLVKQEIPNLGKDYLVIDPACGSGNLVTNWRSPLELRHKVVSEIEPELLYAVEQRMKGDQWHNGKFTVVPKVNENRGLNFIDKSPQEYLEILTSYLAEKGHRPDKPLAFLCNPPYRNDDDQKADSASYEVHSSIVEIVGTDASSERYCSFLAQMKGICDCAESSGLPSESVLLLFTKAAWLTKRPVFQQIRRSMLSSFEECGGILVNGKEFFDLKGKFPIAFTIWKYVGKDSGLNPDREIEIRDMTWLKKSDLNKIDWMTESHVEEACTKILRKSEDCRVHLGSSVTLMKEWVEATRFEFQRAKRKHEKESPNFLCGLPKGDRRHARKKTLGEATGKFIGFMDDLTPCRIAKNPSPGVPWFRLNSPIMDCRKSRCFSGPVDQKGFSSDNIDTFFKMSVWYSLGRIFSDFGYPMWVDAMELWKPVLTPKRERILRDFTYGLLLVENECVETRFPSKNPVEHSIELCIANPLAPNDKESFWVKKLLPELSKKSEQPAAVKNVIAAVKRMYVEWEAMFGRRVEIIPPYSRPYFIDDPRLSRYAGVIQIRDYLNEVNHDILGDVYEEVQGCLKSLKEEFYEFVCDAKGLGYFSRRSDPAKVKRPEPFEPKTNFDQTVNCRLAIASMLINKLHDEKNFGRTKFTKLFYLSDMLIEEDLETTYYRAAAGPLDQRALYNVNIGIEAMGQRYGYFKAVRGDGQFVRYMPLSNIKLIHKNAKEILKESDYSKITRLLDLFADMTTDQLEIVATLFACWNDLLIDDKKTSEDMIVREFLEKWHEKKKRFKKTRLLKALKWMKENGVTPDGRKSHTMVKFREF